MKDLIVIGAYCPDTERQTMLNNCIESLQNIRNDFDILISSHTIIPENITKKVDFTFYDSNNDLLTDLEYLNQPWFSPYDGSVIFTTYIGNVTSTYLSVYRVLISSLGIAKTYKYSKVHYIEYDSVINDHSDLYDNSKLLDQYDSVLIKKEPRQYEDNLYWGQGFFISIKLDRLNKLFLEFDREKLLDILSNSTAKTNEKITEEILSKDGNTIYFKDYDKVVSKNNHYKLSNITEKESLSNWVIPFYNPKDDKMYVLSWNDRYDEPITSIFIINDERLISMKNIQKFNWEIKEVGSISELKSITIIVNDKLKNKIEFDSNFNEKFKRTNYILHKN
jgi:hypothetical protein